MRATPRTLLAVTIAVLCGCRSTPTVDPLLTEIRDTTIVPLVGSYDEREQNYAINTVLTVGHKHPREVSSLLVAHLRDPVTEERTKLILAWLLARLKDDRGLPLLTQHIGVPDRKAQNLVRSAVVPFGSQVVPQVREVLETGDETARLAAAEILFEIGRDAGVREAFDALWSRIKREPAADIRFLIISSMDFDARGIAVDRLVESLMDPDEEIREIAWSAVARRSPPARLGFDPKASTVVRSEQVVRLKQWREGQL